MRRGGDGATLLAFGKSDLGNTKAALGIGKTDLGTANRKVGTASRKSGRKMESGEKFRSRRTVNLVGGLELGDV